MASTTNLFLGWWILAAGAAWGQTAPQPLVFEIASVKPADPHARRSGLSTRNGNDLIAENYPLRNLIKFAYGLQDYQLAGSPGWADTEGYDIVAKAPRDEFIVRLPEDPRAITDEQFKTRGERLRARVRSLLAERFGLVVHHEQRPHTIYQLTIASGGPKLTAVTKADDRQGIDDSGKGHAQGFAATMAGLAHVLATAAATTVLDQTGLTGMYDFVLDWAPDADAAAPAGTDSKPSLFTAVQEQLGLRLKPAKGTVDVLVVDQVNRPAVN